MTCRTSSLTLSRCSIYKSNVQGAKNEVTGCSDDYKDAVVDVTEAQQDAMRMLKTLGPQIERWHQVMRLCPCMCRVVRAVSATITCTCNLNTTIVPGQRRHSQAAGVVGCSART